MLILILNVGSASMKFGVFETAADDQIIIEGEFERFFSGHCTLHIQRGRDARDKLQRQEALDSVEHAIRYLPGLLSELGYKSFGAVGHRVVHGGSSFTSATLVDDRTLDAIANLARLSPLHNPVNLFGIRCSIEQWPSTPQVAVFDTAFHQTLPPVAHSYAVPKEWRDLGLRRFGFHGISHKYVTQCAADLLQRPLESLRLISCHLGNGSSVCAIKQGHSVDTSMGMTPLEGLVMGTRSGDIDPGLYGHVSRNLGLSIEQIEQALYTSSGLQALAGSSDMRDIEQWAEQGAVDAILAADIYAYHVRKYLGAYTAILGGLDAVIFTGGIGENSAFIRDRVCEKLGFIGVQIDRELNDRNPTTLEESRHISAYDSPVKVIVTKTREQLMIAREVDHLLRQKPEFVS